MRLLPERIKSLILFLGICFLLSACSATEAAGMSSGPVTEKIPEEEMLQAGIHEGQPSAPGTDAEFPESGPEEEEQPGPPGDGTELPQESAAEDNAAEADEDAASAEETETVQPEEDPAVQSVFISGPGEAHGYYYQFLDAAESAAYDSMLQACGTLSARAAFTVPLQETGLYNALDALRYDHPEYYWIRNSSTAFGYDTGDIVGMEFAVPADAGRVLQQILAAADSITAPAAGMAERDKARYLYGWIIANTGYGTTDGSREQTAAGVLLDHRAVCAGYADAFKLLCDRAGIACTTVVGNALNEDGSLRGKHAWNQIVIGGARYWIDVTWGDPQFGSEQHWDPGWINYDPFCVADDPFLKNHVIDRTLGRGAVSGHFSASYAACGDRSLDEYVLTGRCFDSLQDAAGYVSTCLASGIPYFSFRMTSDPVFAETYSWLFEGGGMQQILDGAAVPYTEYQCFSDSVFRTVCLEFR